jgi:formylglycine-generating enzyme required for sulfatase activity
MKNPAIPGPVFIRIEGGTFIMGSTPEEQKKYKKGVFEKFGNTECQHKVTVSTFYMCSYEVTQREFVDVMEFNPSTLMNLDFPVDCVGWFDAVKFCNDLSKHDGYTPVYTIIENDESKTRWNRAANGYRLPTEAEWEYACRAGTTATFYTGDSVSVNDANFKDNTFFAADRMVIGGSYLPNPWGLYDIAGNVYEWCWDWYKDDYDLVNTTNPAGPAEPPAGKYSRRTLRGGCWFLGEGVIRSGNRDNELRGRRFKGNGFRLVRNG